MRFMSVFVLVSICAAGSSLAQPPHVGTWEIDYTKSDGSEQVWSFVDLGAGLWEFQSDGRKIFHFRMDDEECATCTGFYRWELIGPGTYLTNFVGPTARDIVRISEDGDSLSFIQRIAANGTVEERVGTFERLSGGPGLAGTWRSESERSASPPVLELSPAVDEWFVFKSARPTGLPRQETVCVLLLDGGDHPCFGTGLGRGWTLAMKLVDPRTLEAVVKVDGDTAAESVYTVSPGGRSMTRTQPSAAGGSIETVYNRRR